MISTDLIPSGFIGEKAIVIPYDIRHYMDNHLITTQLYVTHIGYYPHALHHFRERQEGVEQFIFIYCEKGSGWIEYNNERFVVEKNHFFILPPFSPHKYGSDSQHPWSIYWFHFKGKNAPMFESIIGKPILIPDADNSRYQERISLFAEIFRNLEMGYNTENLEYITFCLMHFMASLKYVTQFREIKSVNEADVIQKSIAFMKDHLEEKITLKEIASFVGYSVPRFHTLFKERTRFCPMEYNGQLKIQRACAYLQFSRMKIKEIAFRLHYCDPFHFSKSFVKEMQITPKEYRQRYRDVDKPPS